jgi:tRNA1(Val) A37 N6-methylase TrmN6
MPGDTRTTCDYFLDERLRLHQPADGPRVTHDALLLADFVEYRKQETLLDLGCGVGPIALAACLNQPELHCQGLDIDPELVRLANRNATENGLAERAQFLTGDWNEALSCFDECSFSLIVCNPPYLEQGSGRISPNPQVARARHLPPGGLHDLLKVANRLLKAKGRLAVIYRAEGAAQIIGALLLAKLEPKRIRFVHPRPKADANFIMIEAIKDGGTSTRIEPPLYL